jgi:hypothetical protein
MGYGTMPFHEQYVLGFMYDGSGWNKGWNAVAAKPVNNNHTISLALSPPSLNPLMFTQFYMQ